MRGFLTTGLGAFAVLLIQPTAAFYIPGWSVKSYQNDEHLPLLVNKVYSDNTQLQYAYYDLPFVCPPSGQRRSGFFSGQNIPLNLGEVLRGDRITVSDIDLAMGNDKRCTALCHHEVDKNALERAKDLVRDGYVVEWIVDNLPGATSFVTVDKTRKYYAAGFKLGYTDYPSAGGPPRYYLNNHYTIVIRYRRAPGRAGDDGGKVVVGFEVYPKSIGPGNKLDAQGCPLDLQNISNGLELAIPLNRTSSSDKDAGAAHATISIPYTYSVYFREDETIEWNHRWDLYFVNQEEGSKIHWLAIVNSLFICAMLTGVVVIILAKTIRADIKSAAEEARGRTRTRRAVRATGEKPDAAPGLLAQDDPAGGDLSLEDLEDGDEALEDVAGWKLLHADVFRVPRFGYLLAPLVGSGVQLLLMAFGLVLLSALGILNPSFRGGFVSVGVGLFIFNGLFSGFFSGRIFKTLNGQNWRSNAFVTAMLFPGLLFALGFVLNLFVWAQASSTAIPFGTLVAIVLLWLCIQVPLVYVGSHYGYNRVGSWDHPTKTTALPRQIPQQAWYIKSVRAILLAGLIPFAVIFIELLFVFRSIWQDKSGYYYVFGFLFAVSLILLVTVAEVTIVTIYVQLCSENHHWWWQSFLVGGGSAIWIFLYSVWYFFWKLHVSGFVSAMLFFSYSFVACCVYAILTGTVGFLSAYAFIRRIYGAIKVD